MTKFLFTVIFATTIISAAMAQKTSKEEKAAIQDAVSYAGSVAFVYANTNAGVLKNMLNPKFMERPVFISYTSDGTGLDASIELPAPFGKKSWFILRNCDRMRSTNLYDGQAYVTFAGTYVLLVPRNGSIVEVTKTGSKKFDVDSLTFTFEERKYYSIDSRVDKENKIEFSIKETDATAYSAYQDANPNRFDGTWSGEKKALRNIYLNQYSFDGNKMKFEGSTKLPKHTYIAEGSIMYNENTIIFIPEKASRDGKEVKDFNDAPYVWYYTLTGNELNLEEGRQFNSGWENTGIFQKMD